MAKGLNLIKSVGRKPNKSQKGGGIKPAPKGLKKQMKQIGKKSL